MDSKKTSSVSLKTLKSLLRLAEENELQLLEFNSVKILRGGPISRSKTEATQIKKPTGIAVDLPESVEEMDSRLHDRLKELM